MLGAMQCFSKVSTLHFSELAFMLDHIAWLLTPFTSGPPKCCEVGHATICVHSCIPHSGGWKGQTGPGDAHPYLVLFGWNEGRKRHKIEQPPIVWIGGCLMREDVSPWPAGQFPAFPSLNPATHLWRRLDRSG
jgi:hypothetical protein